MTGHGCFSSYLHRIGKLTSPECWYCGSLVDDAFHTLFQCDAWHHRMTSLQHTLEERVNLDTIAEEQHQLEQCQRIFQNRHRGEGRRGTKKTNSYLNLVKSLRCRLTAKIEEVRGPLFCCM